MQKKDSLHSLVDSFKNHDPKLSDSEGDNSNQEDSAKKLISQLYKEEKQAYQQNVDGVTLYGKPLAPSQPVSQQPPEKDSKGPASAHQQLRERQASISMRVRQSRQAADRRSSRPANSKDLEMHNDQFKRKSSRESAFASAVLPRVRVVKHARSSLSVSESQGMHANLKRGRPDSANMIPRNSTQIQLTDTGYGENEISRIAWEGRQMAMSMQKSTEDVSKSLNSSNFPIKRQSTRHKKTDSQVPTLNLNKSIGTESASQLQISKQSSSKSQRKHLTNPTGRGSCNSSYRAQSASNRSQAAVRPYTAATKAVKNSRILPGRMFDDYQQTYSFKNLPLKSDKPPLGGRKSNLTMSSTIDTQDVLDHYGQAPAKRAEGLQAGVKIDGVSQKLLKALYEAKCKDLQIPANLEQERRFFKYCKEHIKNRRIRMNEQGLGPNAAAVIGQIIAAKSNNPQDFCHLDLGKNNLGNEGVAALMKGISRCKTLVSMDLGSNDIMLEGASLLFRALWTHGSLSVLTIANHDRLHRNRIGLQACEDLKEMLMKNRIISSLNVADNRIGNEGLHVISPALDEHCTLVTLNMQNNDLEGLPIVSGLSKYLKTTRNLIELNLGSNKIGDAALTKLGEVFQDNSCRLQKLGLQNCSVTAAGVGVLLHFLRINNYLRSLNLNNNDLSGTEFNRIQLMLWNNRVLQSLSLSGCRLGKVAAEAIGEGLSKNSTLLKLDISDNAFPTDSLHSWVQSNPKSLRHLRSLDISQNHHLGGSDILHLLHCFRNQTFKLQKVEPRLNELNLKDTNMSEEAAKFLLFQMASNTTLVRVCLECNSLPQHYLDEVATACRRNKQFEKQRELPKQQQELDKLLRITKNGQVCNLERRQSCIQKVVSTRFERGNTMTQLFEREQFLDQLRVETGELKEDIRVQQEQNQAQIDALDDRLDQMDTEIEQRKKVLEGKLDGMHLKIAIVKHKQAQTIQETEDAEKEIQCEKRKRASMAEELERKVVQIEKKKAERQLVCNAYEKNIRRMQQEIGQSVAQSLETASEEVRIPGEDKENRWDFGTRLESGQSTQNRLNNQRSLKRLSTAANTGNLKRLSQKAIKRNRSQQHGASRQPSKPHLSRKSCQVGKKAPLPVVQPQIIAGGLCPAPTSAAILAARPRLI